MALKLQVTFDEPVRIVGEPGENPIKNHITFVCKPFTTDEGADVDITHEDYHVSINGVTTFKESFTIQGKIFNYPVIVFNPSDVEDTPSGKLKCTFPSQLNSIVSKLKTINYFYEKPDGDGVQRIVRRNVPADLSKPTQQSTGITSSMMNSVQDSEGNFTLDTKEKFDFEINSGSINAAATEITFNLTNLRNLTLKNQNGNITINEADINKLLNLKFSKDDLYYETIDSENTSKFTIKAGGITLNDNILKLNVTSASGKLVGSSVQNHNSANESASDIVIKGEGEGNITGVDQFDLPLKISEEYTFTNNIKNPGLKAVVYPRDAFDAYIGLELYETDANNAPRITNLDTAYGEAEGYDGPEGTLRHGKKGDIDGGLTQHTHPVAASFSITAVDSDNTEVNPYAEIGNIKFAFDQNTKIEESSDKHTSKLIVKERIATGDIIGLRLDRFPRYGINYSITYNHKTNKTSGIFNSDGNPVIVPTGGSIILPVNNQLQEVTGTVGKFKVYYPPNKPSEWNNPSGSFDETNNQYQDYTAYYYVDITFKRGNTPALITAKYNWNPELFQTQAGHNIHHGLILTKNSNNVIDEEITRTTIRDNDDKVVFLENNNFGTKLRIELPVAIGDDSNKYPYDTNADTGLQLTSKNFADLDSNSQLDLIDRQERTNGQVNGSYYYINVMDNLGNVVSPIKNHVLQTDNDWGKASDGSLPEIEKAEYKAEFVEGSWIKKVVMTFKHDLKENTGVNISNLFNSFVNIDNDGLTIQKDSTAITQNDNEVSIKVQDAAAGSNNGTLTYNSVDNGDVSVAYTQGTTDTNTIFNWLGFKIASFNKNLVLADGMSDIIPTISNLSFTTTLPQPGDTSFSGNLTWDFDSGSTNGLTYKVEYSTSSDFATIAGTATQAHTGDADSDQTATISGLSFNTGYYFRVTPNNFDEGVSVSTTTAFSQTGPAGQLQNFNVVSSAGPTVVASWDKPADATQYKIEYRKMNYDTNEFGSWLDITGFSHFIPTETSVSFTFDENENTGPQLDANTKYELRASYSTTPNAGPNTIYTFGGSSNNMPVEIITFPDESYTFTIKNSSQDDNLEYNQLKVTWNSKPTDFNLNNETGVSYEIEVSTASDFSSQITDSPFTPDLLDDVREKKIQGLNASTTYYIRIRSKNQVNQYTNYIPSSTGQSKSTNSEPIAGLLENFSVVSSAGPTVTASWTKPADATQYKLEYSERQYSNESNPLEQGEASFGDWQKITGLSEFTTTETSVSYEFSGDGALNANTQYKFRVSYSVTASSPYTFGDVSEEKQITTYPDESFNNLNVSANESTPDTKLDVSWTAHQTDSNENGVEGLLIYQIQIATNDEFTDAQTSQTTAGQEEEVENTIIGLSASTSYYIRVRSRNTHIDSNGAFDFQTTNWKNYSSTISTSAAQPPVIVITEQVPTIAQAMWPSFKLSSSKSGIVSVDSPQGISIRTGSEGYSNTIRSFAKQFTLQKEGTDNNTFTEGTYNNIVIKVTASDGSSATETLDEFTVDIAAPYFVPYAEHQPTVPANGTSFTIKFNEEIKVADGGTVAEGFTVTVADDTATFSASINNDDSKYIDFNMVNGVIYQDETVSLSYTKPDSANDRITDNVGKELPNSTLDILNTSAVSPDTTAPSLNSELSSVTTAGNKIILQFSEDLKLGGTTTAIPTDAFSVLLGGDYGSGSISSVNFHSNDDSKIEINLSGFIYKNPHSSNVTVSYTQQGGDNNLRDNAGNLLANIINSSVNNDSEVLPDTSGPLYSANPTWKFKRGDGSFTALTEAIYLKENDQLKVEFTATDDTNCIFSEEPSVNINNGVSNNAGAGEILTTAQQSGSSNTYDLSITYKIGSDVTDNGTITFGNIVLSDGTNTSSVPLPTPPYTVTADNIAPELKLGLANGNPRVLQNGTTIIVNFTIGANLDDSLNPNFEVNVGTGQNIQTYTPTQITFNAANFPVTNKDYISLEGDFTILEDETVTLTYTSGIKDLAGNDWSPNNWSPNNSVTISPVKNNSSQTPPDTSAPSIQSNSVEWFYAAPAIVALGDPTGGSPTWNALSDPITIGRNYKVKVEFDAIDATNVSFDSELSVKINNNATNIVMDSKTVVADSGADNTYNLTMILTIPSSATAGALSGPLTLEVTLTDGVAGNANTSLTLNPPVTITVDNVAPILSNYIGFTTPTNDNTPSFSFDSNEAGTVSISPTNLQISNSSNSTAVINGTNTFTFAELADGTYNSVSITVTDSFNNTSTALNIPTFIVDSSAPGMTITSSTVTNGSSSTDTEIDLKFTSSEPTNDFEEIDITYNGGTLSDFATVFKVTVQNVNGNKYFINDIQQDKLVLKSGNTYRFDQSDSTNGSHPLRFSQTSGGAEYTTGVTVVGIQGQSGSYTQIVISGSTPTTLYYYCTAHPGMGEEITISNSNATRAKEYVAKLTTTQAGDYTIDVNASKFTDEAGNNNVAASQFSWTRTSIQLALINNATYGGPGARILANSDDTIEIRFNKDLDTTITLMNATSSPPVSAFHVYARDSTYIEQRVADDPTTIESIEYYTWGGNAQGGNYNGIKIKVGDNGNGGASNKWKEDDNNNHFFLTEDVTLIYNSNAVTIKDTDGNAWSQSSTEEIPVENNSNSSYVDSNDLNLFSVAISSSDINSGATTSESEINLEFNLGAATNDFSGNDITVDTGATISDFATIFDVTVIDGKYYINLGVQKDLELRKGDTYRFDQSDNSNQNHPLKFSTTSNGTHGGGSEYTTGVTVVGTPGSPGAYTQIEIDSNFNLYNKLYYYCSNHSGMGGEIDVVGNSQSVTSSKKYLAKHTTNVSSSTTFTIKVLADEFQTMYKSTDTNSASNVFSLTYAPSWSQLGADIDGEGNVDNLGWAVSISSDGSIVAIGAKYAYGNSSGGDGYFGGHVRVYENNNGTWTQLGSDIDGEAPYNYSGVSVSLSSDGTRVAIGAIGYNNNRGHVRVYQYSSGSWTKLGSNIDGEAGGDMSGWSVSLSSNGSRVAMGSIYNDAGNTSSTDNRGHVRVYEYSSSTTPNWTQLGSDIDGIGAGDKSGYSVSLSSDGSIVAIGAIGHDGINGSDLGLVRVYEWDGSSWDQKGTDIYGEAGGDESGYSVSLSSDGSILAIGARYNDAGNANTDNRGHVRVYKWVVSDGEAPSAWQQLGSDIDGEAAGDESGYSVSLSSDGSILAIGAHQNDAGNANSDNRGHVRVYQYSSSNNSWSQLGSDIDGKAGNELSGYSVAIDASGNTVAIGAPGEEALSKGKVRVYEYS